jgi:S-adenosylmethionine:tRNA ribosyltransferase-isomerase
MKVSDFDYTLPQALIAQAPAPRRDSSRLMVLDTDARSMDHRRFLELPRLLRPKDLLVLNDTKVVRARLLGRRSSGGRVEILLLDKVAGRTRRPVYRALIKPLERLRRDEEIFFERGFSCRLLDPKERLVAFREGEAERAMAQVGHVPLPPYIRRPDRPRDRVRYQTVFARAPGAVAAPTAGLHFTWRLFKMLKARGVGVTTLTLHVGYATFAPVRSEEVAAHRTSAESYLISPETVAKIRRTRRSGGRVIAVGTTACKALEDAAGFILGPRRLPAPIEGESALFIHPPYRFRVVEGLITNFHLPRTTLLMLVAALAGRDFILRAYREAVAKQYRFYSYGDAMLIV